MRFWIMLLSLLVWIAGLWLLIPVYAYLADLHKFVGGLTTVYLALIWFTIVVWFNYRLYVRRQNETK